MDAFDIVPWKSQADSDKIVERFPGFLYVEAETGGFGCLYGNAEDTFPFSIPDVDGCGLTISSFRFGQKLDPSPESPN